MESSATREYLAKNLFPFTVEAVFILLALLQVIPMIYLNFLFYLALIVYFAFRKEYSWTEWKIQLRADNFGKYFLNTAAIIGIGFLLMTLVQNACPNLPLGEFSMKRDTPFTIFLFAVQTILFPPLAEEMFYRKYLMVNNMGKGFTILTIFISSLLFAAEHAIYPFGLASYMILGIAFAIAYLYCKNIYVLMTVHFVINLLGNGIPLILTLFKA